MGHGSTVGACAAALCAAAAAGVYCPKEWRPAVAWHVRGGLRIVLGDRRVDQVWPLPLRVLGPAELEEHGGDNGPPGAVLVSIGGRVFDTQRSRNLYGDAGWYKFFAGRDATRVFGTGRRVGHSIDPNCGDADYDSIDGLTEKQLRQISHYQAVFEKKYPVIGVFDGRHYNELGEPTEERTEFERKLAEVRGNEDDQKEAKQGAAEDGAFAIDDDDSDGEAETKCPVMKASRAVKKAAKEALDSLIKLIAPPKKKEPEEETGNADLRRREKKKS